jgi:hypothetical protein
LAEPISQRAYARHRGVTPKAVQKAIASGRISIMAGGKVDPVVADAEWARNTDQTKPLNSVTGNPRHRRPAGAPPVPGAGAGDVAPRSGRWGDTGLRNGAASSYAAARALRETYNAKIAKLEYERLSGLLVSGEEVRAASFAVSRRARDQLFAIPDRVSATLAGIEDPHEVKRILLVEIRRVCEELARGFAVDRDGEDQA